MTENNSKSDINLPDIIIGLGNGGKNIVYELIDREWVRGIGVEPQNNPSSTGTQAYIIDSAEAEKSDDKERVEELQGKIARTWKREYPEMDNEPPLQIEYINPQEEADSKYTSMEALTATGPVQEIGAEHQLNAWWLENNDSHLTSNRNFDKGVLRRRALSKALFFSCQIGRHKLQEVMNAPGRDVYIVVGLGGGTGSGMFLDLAKQFAERGDKNVHLVGIIPQNRENPQIKANAYAALSELEYLAIQKRNPFRNILLLPFGPTTELDSRDDFYDAAIQTILTHNALESNHFASIDEEDQLGPELPAAPFTLAIPQILRFATEDIRTARDQLQDFIEAKQEALAIEEDLYDHLEEFLFSEYEDQEPAERLKRAKNWRPAGHKLFNLDEQEAERLRKRIGRLVDLLDSPLFDQLQYEAAQWWYDSLVEHIDSITNEANEDDRLDELLAVQVPDLIRGLPDAEDRYPVEENDRVLDRLVRTELQMIKRRGDLLRTAHLIHNEGGKSIADGIRDSMGQSQTARTGVSVRGKYDDLTAEIEELDERIGTLEQFDKEYAKPAVEEAANEWRDRVTEDFDQLISLEENRERIEELLDALREDIRKAVEDAQQAQRSNEVPENGLEFDSFDELNRRLSEVGMDDWALDGFEISQSVGRFQWACLAWHEAQESREDIIDTLLRPLGLSNVIEESRQEFHNYREDIDPELIEITSEFEQPFAAEFTGDQLFDARIAELQSKREQIIDKIIEDFEANVRTVRITEQDLKSFIEDTDAEASYGSLVRGISWPGSVEETDNILRAAFTESLAGRESSAVIEELCSPGGGVYKAFDQANRSPIREKVRELERERNNVDRNIVRHDELLTLINEEGNTLSNLDVPAEPDINFESSDYSNPYIKQLDPRDQGSLMGYETIGEAKENHELDQEKRRIKNALNEFARNILRLDDRTPLRRKQIKGQQQDEELDRIVYDQHRIIIGYLSRYFDNSEHYTGPLYDQEVFEPLNEEIYVRDDETGYKASKISGGAPWDIGMTVFIGGIMLDNLRLVTQTEMGYYSSYMELRESIRDEYGGDQIHRMIVRHTHGVDGKDPSLVQNPNEGACVIRSNLFNFNSVSDRNKLVNSGREELAAYIRDEMYEINRFESTIDLNTSKIDP